MEFLERLGKDEVIFVEFMAPDGDAAYATFKSTGDEESKPIRIGEGKKIEKPSSYSSTCIEYLIDKNISLTRRV